MKRAALIMTFIAAFAATCGQAVTPFPVGTTATEKPQPRTLTVFAAASLTDAFSEIGKNFEAVHPGVTVTFNFAGSQTLSTQIMQGAAADVFASANHTEMDKLVSDNLVERGAPQDFLTNQLVIILPAQNPANVQSLEQLANPGLKLVLASADVPVGEYARQALENLNALYGSDYENKVLANVVSNEDDVKLVVAKVQLGEADGGIVYVSDAVAATELKTIEIPSNYNVIAKYPIAVLTNAPQPELAAELVAYVLSAEGQAILKKWGFTPITP